MVHDRAGGCRTVQGVFDSEGQCKTGQYRTMQDIAGRCKAGQEDAGLFKECLTVKDSARQGRTVSDSVSQCKIVQDSAGQSTTKQRIARQHRAVKDSER
jgi:hypothetical protein